MHTPNCFKNVELNQNANIEIVGYEDHLKQIWCQMQVDLCQFDSLEEAEEYFAEEFEKYSNELAHKMLFALDKETGLIVGTATLWTGKHFGKILPRLHWIAVCEEYQGQGIAKLLVNELIETYKAGEKGEFIYLTSQTWSYKAINLYSKFGFLPYLGEKPQKWSGTKEEFDMEKREAWKIINEKIEEHESRAHFA